MPDFLSWMAPYAAIGGSAGAGFMFIKWLLEFVAGRWDHKEAAIDAGMKQLLDRLEVRVNELTQDGKDLREQLKVVEGELRECKRRHSESDAEVMRLKAMLQGYGDARQDAQLFIAADKARENGR